MPPRECRAAFWEPPRELPSEAPSEPPSEPPADAVEAPLGSAAAPLRPQFALRVGSVVDARREDDSAEDDGDDDEWEPATITEIDMANATVSLSFGAEVRDGKAMEGALSTQGSVKLFVSFAPYKLVLKNSMYVKKRGISGGRYTEHDCTLSYAEGFDGWTSYRLAYRDSQAVEHAATVIGMQDNAPMRYEYTIVTHENQGYSIRNGTSDEYKQWTEVLKQIVPPPLSRGHAEEAVEGEVKAKKKSIFSRVGGKKTSVTE